MALYTVKASLRSIGLQVKTNIRDHEFIQDELAQYKGTDAGPNPVEFFLSGLSGCLTVSSKDYANHHTNIEVKKFEVETTGETRFYQDGSSKIIHITVKITAETNLNEINQKRYIEEVIRRCTVHSSIEAAIPIDFKY